MNAVVVALGKIGLPLAVQVAGAGNTVTGCDIDEAVVATVNAGSEPFPGEAHLAERLSKAVGEGALTATIDTTAAVGAGPDLVIAVPPLMTREDGTTDWTALDAVVEAIGAGGEPDRRQHGDQHHQRDPRPDEPRTVGCDPGQAQRRRKRVGLRRERRAGHRDRGG